jgi:hypothetical protein
MQKRGYYNNAVISDPCFKDAKNRDFRIALDSPVLGTDFEVWDYEAGTLTQY